MSVKHDILTVGFDKNGEVDFGIRATATDLSRKQINEIRAMIPVAIGVLEDMWRRNTEKTAAAISASSHPLHPLPAANPPQDADD